MPYTIKPISEDHIEARFNAIHDSLAILESWFPWAHDTYSKEECLQQIKNFKTLWEADKDYSFAIIDDETQSYSGEVKIMDVKHDYAEASANISIWTSIYWLRKKVATEGLKQAALFAFNELKLIRLMLRTDVNNSITQETLKSIPAKYEGIERNQWIMRIRIKPIRISHRCRSVFRMMPISDLSQ